MEFGAFVLAASTADLADEPAARSAADVIEFRLDLAPDPLAQLDGYDGELPILVTNRTRRDGGEAAAGADRLDALVEALARPSVAAVDVELEAIESGEADRVVAAARDRGASVVVSSHDVDGTPATEAMARTLREAAATGDVGKLAVTAASPRDVLDLLAVTWSLTAEGRPVATMAMGEAGRHSRAVAPVYGSRIGYAPVDPADATAPGQYDLATLRELVDALGVS